MKAVTMTAMKALTICQPYAELIALGLKPIENRTWPTSYRGQLLIHAGKSREWMDDEDEARYPAMKFGAAVAVAELVACLHIESVWPERWRYLQSHEHANGPFCWLLNDARRIAPVAWRGAQGLWDVPPALAVAMSADAVDPAPASSVEPSTREKSFS